MVPCFCLKPKCSDGISLLSSVTGVSCLNSIFSRTLDRIGRTLIGRYDAMSSEFFPSLAIIMICPTFHGEGKYSMRIMVFVCGLSL